MGIKYGTFLDALVLMFQITPLEGAVLALVLLIMMLNLHQIQYIFYTLQKIGSNKAQ